ncbi:hypothetical protein CTRI78_v004662 [Colletotrichum trifolii]|uniref:Uncharacterized protein n=1 Tax=Colletotrichum trifolii TaxID=5466 RepID=A0A4R8RGI1_COLTR|nr:hypothetical protein CTRI78_v004662 [Colletotrichum trifolii]
MHFSTILATILTLAPALVLADDATANCPRQMDFACSFGRTPRCLSIGGRNVCVTSCPASTVSCPENCVKAGKGGGWCGVDNTGRSTGYCVCENGHDTARFV